MQMGEASGEQEKRPWGFCLSEEGDMFRGMPLDPRDVRANFVLVDAGETVWAILGRPGEAPFIANVRRPEDGVVGVVRMLCPRLSEDDVREVILPLVRELSGFGGGDEENGRMLEENMRAYMEKARN